MDTNKQKYEYSVPLHKLMEELRQVAPDKIAAIEKKMKEEAAALW